MSAQSRRKLLKSIAAGSGAIVAGKSLPESWSRPVVDSVMLPAHAMTSTTRIYAATDIQAVSIETNNGSMLAHWLKDGLDLLIPSASAQGFTLNGCVTVTGENVDFWLQLTAPFQQVEVLVGEAQASFLNGDTGVTTLQDYFLTGDNGCDTPVITNGEVVVIELTDDYIRLGADGDELTLFLAPSCPEKLKCVELNLPGN